MKRDMKLVPIYLLSGLAVVCIAIAVYIAQGNSVKSNDSAYQTRSKFANTVIPNKPISNQAEIRFVNDSKHLSTNQRNRSPSEVSTVEKWLNQKGGFDVQSRNDYMKMYSEDQLLNLANQGDTTAAAALDMFYTLHGQLEKIPSVAGKCISYGSLACISDMAVYFSPPIMNSSLSLEEILPKVMNSLAYYHLLELRGAGKVYNTNLDESIIEEHLLKRYGYVLTEEDNADINKKAKQLYSYYQSERQKLGLGNFDNSIPDDVKTFFSKP